MEENNNNTKPNEERDKNINFSVKLKKYIKNLFDFSRYSKKTIVSIIIFGFIVVFSIIIFIYNYFIDNTFLYSIVVNFFVIPVQSLGIWGIFIFILAMGIQGLIIPIPSEIVLLSTGVIWGVWGGAVMGIIGSMAAGILCFYVSRKGGRPIAEKFVGEKAMKMADHFIEKYGIWAIIISRSLPLVAFDPISYVSGLVEMDVKKYAIGTLIGSIPRAIFWALLGSLFGIDPNNPNIIAASGLFNIILLILVVVMGIMFLLYYFYSIYWVKKHQS